MRKAKISTHNDGSVVTSKGMSINLKRIGVIRKEEIKIR